jgi:hypothetical protein
MRIKQTITRSYFYRLYQTNKFLFVFISLFFLLSIFSNIIKLQTTPFFVWNMYAFPIQEKKIYEVYEIRYNQNKIFNLPHTWQEPAKNLFSFPLYFYINSRKDPANFRAYMDSVWLPKHAYWRELVSKLYVRDDEIREFPSWYRRYLAVWTGEPIDSLMVLNRKVSFNNDGTVRLMRTDTALKINYADGR